MLLALALPAVAEEAADPSLAGVKARLAQEVQQGQAPDAVHLSNGRVVRGRIVEEGDEAVVLSVPIGTSGALHRRIPRAQIREIRRGEAAAVTISDDEARIRQEFPSFRMIRRGGYTVFTDQDYALVETLLLNLERLRQEFVRTFGPALETWDDAQPAYVLVFGDEALYQRYAARHLASAEFSAGFFNPQERRLVLYNHFGSEGYQQLQRQLKSLRDEGRVVEGGTGSRAALQMKQLNRRIIRHEGTHQLCHLAGLLDGPLGRQVWLAEGLATYCETAGVGGVDDERVALLQQHRTAGTLIPLREVISRDDLFGNGEGSEAQLRLAYAQAWSLTRYLMMTRRQLFLEYLRGVGRRSAGPPLSSEERWQALERHLGVGVPTLEAEWRKSLEVL